MIVVDFDRTLFDSDGFYDAIRVSLPQQPSQDEWHDAYKRYQNKYRHMNIFELIRDEYRMSDNVVAQIQEKARDLAPQYLYDDAHDFLASLQTNNIEYTILTFGNPAFQKFKIEASGLSDHPYLVTSEPKKEHQILDTALAIIDDNPGELQGITQKRTTRIRMARPNSKYATIQPDVTFDRQINNLRAVNISALLNKASI